MPRSEVPEPWHSFLAELNAQFEEDVAICCLGGFVGTVLYGLERATSDIDFISAAPLGSMFRLEELGGKDTPLNKKYGVYLQHVTIVEMPEDFETRLVEMFPSTYSRLRLFALDPYDLALSKLVRNAPHDREDVKQLAMRVPLDSEKLKQRYEAEMRPYLATQEREDLTMKLWVEMIDEVRGKEQLRR